MTLNELNDTCETPFTVLKLKNYYVFYDLFRHLMVD